MILDPRDPSPSFPQRAMQTRSEEQFQQELDKKLWTAAAKNP